MSAPATSPPPRQLPAWLLFAGCLLLAALAYLPSAFQASYLNFDDNLFFGPDNPEFRAGDLGAILDPGRTIANAYLPVTHLSLYLDHVVFAGSAPLSHVLSLLLHALAGFALLRWLAAAGASMPSAAVAAALFLVHPALAESVAWTSGRKDVLCGLFTFLALGQTARLARAYSPWRLLAAAGLSVLALYSKPTAVVLPLLAAAVALCQRGTDRRRWLGPLVLLLCALPAALHHRHFAAQEGTMAAGAAGERLLQVPGALLHYLATTVWPVRLNVLYPEAKTLEAFRAAWLPGLLVLGALLALAVAAARRPRLRPVALGLGLLLLALLPFNTAWPASSIAAADRYLYLALPGAALAVAAALAALAPRAAWLGLLLVLPLLGLAHRRALDFAASERLWQSSLAVEPDNAVAWLNLAAELQRQSPGDHGRLLAPLERAAAAAVLPVHRWRAERALLQLARLEGRGQEAALRAQNAVDAAEALLAQETHPRRRRQAAGNLLDSLLEAYRPLQDSGQQERARRCLDRARELAPRLPAVVAFTAGLEVPALERELAERAQAGGEPVLAASDPRAIAARELLAPALSDHPDDPDLNHVAGLWEQLQGRGLAALKHFRRAIAGRPLASESYLAAASLCRQRALHTDAERFARAGLQVNADPRLRYELALALAGQGRLDDAIGHLEAYAQVRPKDLAAARSLASFLVGKAIARLGDAGTTHAELEALLAKAEAWHPGEPRAGFVRARMCRDQRRFAEAIGHLERFLAAVPDFEDAKVLLAECLRDLGYERKFAGDEDGCLAAWRRFLALAPAELDTEAVRMQLQSRWQRCEQQGVDQLEAGDRAGAVASFRRCLEIDPDQHWGAWLLASALFDQPGADLLEVDRLLLQAVEWQRRHGLDRSRQVLLRAWTLRRLQRSDEARRLASDYLAAPDADAAPEVLAALRQAAQD